MCWKITDPDLDWQLQLVDFIKYFFLDTFCQEVTQLQAAMEVPPEAPSFQLIPPTPTRVLLCLCGLSCHSVPYHWLQQMDMEIMHMRISQHKML